MPPHQTWQQTPVWHPRYWIGHRMRRWEWDGAGIGGEYDGEWNYQTYRQRALEVLAEQHAEQTQGEQGINNAMSGTAIGQQWREAINRINSGGKKR